MPEPIRTEERANYERSFSSMWLEIQRARDARDDAIKKNEAGRCLAIAIRHECGNGLRVTEEIHKFVAAVLDDH